MFGFQLILAQILPLWPCEVDLATIDLWKANQIVETYHNKSGSGIRGCSGMNGKT
jgi:hypothetical protein